MTKIFGLFGFCLLLAPPAYATFETYSRAVASTINRQHRSQSAFLAPVDASRLRRGELVVERLTPPHGSELPGKLLHHWRGTAFAPGATAEEFEKLLRDFDSYPRCFAPRVVAAKVLSAAGDHVSASVRVREHHAITVVLEGTYAIAFGGLDPRHRFSASVSTRIDEIADAGTSRERALSPAEEHGFLLRLNTWWTFEEHDDGLFLQIEAVSLTRAVPRFLEWAIGGYVESIPRESLEFTLRAGRDALKRSKS